MLFLFLSCAPKATELPPGGIPQNPPPTIPAFATELVASMDTSVDPCTDFYQYACGGWQAKTPLPADKPSWSRSFSTIQDANRQKLKALLEEAASNPASEDARRAGSFYGACMDEPAAEAAGVAALAPLFAEIGKVKDIKSFSTALGSLHASGLSPLLEVYIDSDFKNPDEPLLQLMQGGLALPDRSYYTPSDEAGVTLLNHYKAHIAAMLVFSGMPKEEAELQAGLVLELEKMLAEAWMPRSELNDPDKIYHRMDIKNLQKTAPGVDWPLFLTAMGAGSIKELNVMTPDVFSKYQGIFAKAKIDALRSYLRWTVMHGIADALGPTMYSEHFGFFGKEVLGIQEPEARWKRCVRATDLALGEVTGKLFVEKHFAGDSKPTASSMIKSIEEAFEAGLPSLAWMDEATRTRAAEKARLVSNKIGYPDAWRDYSTLTLNSKDNAGNVLATKAFEVKRNIAKLSKPVDKAEWFMSAPMVNAYYNPTWNEIVFPAGILQPPFFAASLPSAMNYGGIGWVMGHELTHGFDDGGRKFDGLGRLTEWWAPEVAGRYEERAACVEKAYSAYEVQPGLFVDGKLTLGENIADLGGLKLAYRAFKASSAPPASVPGLTDDQLFFVAAAQNWCNVASPQWETMLVRSNTHSPGRFRVIGPMSHLPEFHTAFSCEADKPMHPATVCEVW